MHRECRERFPRHRLQIKPLVSDPSMHHGTCVTHVPWCMSGSLTRSCGEDVSGIAGACVTRNFTYLARGPSPCSQLHLNPGKHSTIISLQRIFCGMFQIAIHGYVFGHDWAPVLKVYSMIGLNVLTFDWICVTVGLASLTKFSPAIVRFSIRWYSIFRWKIPLDRHWLQIDPTRKWRIDV